jgi:hypothetical protein
VSHIFSETKPEYTTQSRQANSKITRIKKNYLSLALGSLCFLCAFVLKVFKDVSALANAENLLKRKLNTKSPSYLKNHHDKKRIIFLFL